MRCQVCRSAPREWAWQPFGPDEAALSFAAPGHHYRGFPVLAVCDLCKERLQRGEGVTFTYRGHGYRMRDGVPSLLPVPVYSQEG